VKIAVEARHMTLTDAIRQYVESKVDKLPRFYDNVLSVDVVLDMEADQPVVEIHVSARQKHVFVAHHRDEDLYSCVDQCVAKITRQLRRHKDRVRGHRPAPTGDVAAGQSDED